MHIMDILQNSIRAKATRVMLDIKDDTQNNELSFTITDNGIGMPSNILRQVTDPFFTTRTTRRVGLGLSLLKQNAERTGGSLSIESAEGIGTRLKARFIKDSIDRPSLGDISSAVLLTVTANPAIDFEYTHTTDGRRCKFHTTEVRKALGDIPINEPSVYGHLLEMINENLKEIGAN